MLYEEAKKGRSRGGRSWVSGEARKCEKKLSGVRKIYGK